MLEALDAGKDIHELIDLMVCNKQNKNCMLHSCNSCPGIDAVESYLYKYIHDQFHTKSFNLDSDVIDDDIDSHFHEIEVKYLRWVTTDHSQLLKQSCSLGDFIEKFASKSHSFITKAQNKFLATAKSTLQPNQAIAILDFSQNYSFLIQDEVQGFHWNKSQCTLHPVAIYWKKAQ